MKSKRAKSLAILTASIIGLAACAGGGGSESTGSNATSGSSQDAANETLTIWHMENTPQRVAAWGAIAEEYNATNPEYPVEFQVQEWDSIYASIAAGAQSGTQPDVLFAIPDFATYVRNLGLGYPVTETVDSLDSAHGLYPAARAAYTDGGEDWAIPLYGMVQVLWYNSQMLEAAGVEAPSTWSELVAAAEALTTDTVSGIAVPAGKNLASDQVAYSFMLTGGAGNWFTEDGQPNFNTPEVIDAITLYNDLLEYSPADSANYAWGEPQAALNNGSAAMAIEKGQYLPPWVAESGLEPSDLGCAPIPVKDQGGEPGSIYYSNAAMLLSDDESRRAGAAEFFTWLMEPETYASFLHAEPGLFLPVTGNEAHVEQWRSNDTISTYPECVDLMLELSTVGGLFGFVDGQYISRIGDISGQNILAQVIQRVYVEGESPESAVAWGQQEMEKALQ